MLGGIIGGALGALGGIFGGISKNKMLKRMRNMINEQKRENQDWYDRRYNEDSTQRADAQAILTQTADMIRRRNQQSAGAQAVMGGTEESAAAAKEANAKALSDATSQIAVAGAQRKDQIEGQYRSCANSKPVRLMASAWQVTLSVEPQAVLPVAWDLDNHVNTITSWQMKIDYTPCSRLTMCSSKRAIIHLRGQVMQLVIIMELCPQLL